MKVLLTGGTGFIGRHVFKELEAYSDIEVVVLSRNINDTNKRIQNCVQHDILEDSPIGIMEKCGNPDVVIHLAWGFLNDYENKIHEKEIYPKHWKFLYELHKGGVQDITVIGTCQEYGMQEGCLVEEFPSMPTTSYAISKDKLREQIFKKLDKEIVNIKWLRLFYLYGEGQSSTSLLAQLDKVLESGGNEFNMSGGEQIRDYLPVQEAAKFIVKIALQNKISGVINCCSGIPVKVKDLVVSYLDAKGKIIHLNLGYYPYPKYEPMSFWGDTSKLNKIINS